MANSNIPLHGNNLLLYVPEISRSKPILSAIGKVTLITGGGPSIRNAIAIAFSEAQAAVVILTGRTEVHLVATQANLSHFTTTKVDYFVAKITNSATFETVFSTAFHRYGKLDVLVNNAGYLSMHTSIAKSPLEDYWCRFEIKVKDLIITTGAFMKIAHAGPTVISVSLRATHIAYIESFAITVHPMLKSTAAIIEYVKMGSLLEELLVNVYGSVTPCITPSLPYIQDQNQNQNQFFEIVDG